jgi:cell division protein ZapA
VSEGVKIDIYGQTYHIVGDLQPEYVEQLAEYVDRKMREVARSTGTVDSVRVAVLSALAIADELHALKQSRDDSRERLRERAERCLKLVERALQQSA